MKTSSSNGAVDDSDTESSSSAMDDSTGDIESHHLEELVQVRDHLLSLFELEQHQQSTITPAPIREILASLPCAFNSSVDDLVETLFTGMQDRVDPLDLLPATQDVLGNELDEREGPLTCLQLTRTALTAAHVYALILGNCSGAWSAIRMEAVSALANVLRRWTVECCGREHEWCTTAADPVSAASHSVSDADCNSPVQKKRRQRVKTYGDCDNHHDENENDDYCCLTQTLTPAQLLQAGLQVAQAVAQIPLHREFLNWNPEAVQVLIVSSAGCLATAQAVKAGRGGSTSANSISWPLAQAVVERASMALRCCILSEESPAMQVGLDYFDSVSNPEETMQLKQTTVIAILRGLFPFLIMDETLPKGEIGKVEACNAASDVLMGLIQEINQDILIHPHCWSQGTARRASVASTVPTTGIPSSQPPSTPQNIRTIECQHSTPKTVNTQRRLRKSLGKSTTKRTSMTPKTKFQTQPANDAATGTTTASAVTTNETSLAAAKPDAVFSPIVGMLQRLATSKGLERAAVRSKMVETLRRCLGMLPLKEQYYFLQYLIKQSHSTIAVHRLVASELMGLILSEDWLWKDHVCGANLGRRGDGDVTSPPPTFRTPFSCQSNQSLSLLVEASTSNMPLALFGALQGRLHDRAPTTRATAATALAKLGTRFLQARQDLLSSIPSLSRSELGLVAVLGERVDALVQSLRTRAALDDKATVRRTACTALVELLLVCESVSDEEVDYGISEHDVQILAEICRQDGSLLTRRAAAEGLTRWLEYASVTKNNPSVLTVLIQAWISSALTMVLDSEATCVIKAVELAERVVLFPILNADNDNSNVALAIASQQTSWRILASLCESNGTGNRIARGEAEALRLALEKSIAATHNKNPYLTGLFRTIQRVAVATLGDDINETDPTKTAETETQRTGVWTLLEAAMGHTKDPAELARVIKRSKITLTFLGSSWERLLELCMSQNTQPSSRIALQQSMRKCLNAFSMLTSLVDASVAEKTAASLQNLIGNFMLPPEVIGSAIAALTATTVACCQGESDSTQRQRCAQWIHALYQCCETKIASMDQLPNGALDTVTLARAFFTVGELSMVGFSASDDEALPQNSSSSFNIKKKIQLEGASSSVLVRRLHERPSQQLVDYIRAFMATVLPGSNDTPTPSPIRAHAFLALGKLCLRDPQLAKRSLNILARELHQTVAPDSSGKKDYMVQSNCLLILGDLCVKYTNMVDRYLPVMAGCLQAGITGEVSLGAVPAEGSTLVRKHAILLLSSLLLQDYIKWRGLLFHRFLVASVDEDDEVARLAEMVLFGPLASKQSKLFSNQMVESLFVLNRCTAHPIYQAAAAMGDGGSGISVGFDGINLTGEAGRIRRMRMYQATLSRMSDEEKIMVTARIGKDILGPSLKHGNELHVVCTCAQPSEESSRADYESAFNVLSDALAILSSPWIRVGKNSSNGDDDIEDPNVSTNKAKIAQVAKGRLLSNISRKHLIDILLPVLCNLKAVLQKSCSPLLKDLMFCIVDVYQRYKTEAEECLANAPTTLQEIQYDAQQHRKTQRQKTPGKFKATAMNRATLLI